MLKDSIRLIVNSDDYGLSPAVSRGIRDSHKMGIVTSTTVMISVPGCESDVQLALHETPHLALGLHLTLAGMCCPPVLPPSSVPSLVRNDGNFYDEPEWSRYHDLFNAEEVQRELHAQFDRFVQVVGRPPTHLDSHYHAAYRHPAALGAMLELAQLYKLPIRNPGWDMENLEASLRKSVGDGWYPQMRAVIDSHIMPPCPKTLISVGHNTKQHEFTAALDHLPNGVSELICHAGYVDEQLETSDHYTVGREAEVRLLIDPVSSAAVASRNITLCTFAELVKEVSA